MKRYLLMNLGIAACSGITFIGVAFVAFVLSCVVFGLLEKFCSVLITVIH